MQFLTFSMINFSLSICCSIKFSYNVRRAWRRGCERSKGYSKKLFTIMVRYRFAELSAIRRIQCIRSWWRCKFTLDSFLLYLLFSPSQSGLDILSASSARGFFSLSLYWLPLSSFPSVFLALFVYILYLILFVYVHKYSWVSFSPRHRCTYIFVSFHLSPDELSSISLKDMYVMRSEWMNAKRYILYSLLLSHIAIYTTCDDVHIYLSIPSFSHI